MSNPLRGSPLSKPGSLRYRLRGLAVDVRGPDGLRDAGYVDEVHQTRAGRVFVYLTGRDVAYPIEYLFTKDGHEAREYSPR